MALDKVNAGTLPSPPFQYSREHLQQMIRVLELYFSFLDSDMPQHSEQYTAKRFVGGDFYGGRFFGDGVYLKEDFQRFTSSASQAPAALGTANIVALDPDGFTSSITVVAPGKLHVTRSGTYQITYFLRFGNTAAAQRNAHVWLRLNGVDQPNTNSFISVPATGFAVSSFSYTLLLAAGDDVELAWAPSDIAVSLVAQGPIAAVPGANPAIPATPSAVVNMELVQGTVPADATLPLPRRLLPSRRNL